MLLDDSSSNQRKKKGEKRRFLMTVNTGDVTRLSAGGGALPVIMSIIGPRETHDYRNYNLLGSGINKSKKKRKKGRPPAPSPWQSSRSAR